MGAIKPDDRTTSLRRTRARAGVAIASSATLGLVSLLWLFTLDYTTMWFKITGAIITLIGVAFFAALWIYSGAQLDLEEHLQRRKAVRQKK